MSELIDQLKKGLEYFEEGYPPKDVINQVNVWEAVGVLFEENAKLERAIHHIYHLACQARNSEDDMEVWDLAGQIREIALGTRGGQ